MTKKLKPTPERTKGARNERAAILELIRKRREQYLVSGEKAEGGPAKGELFGLAYALQEIENLIGDHARLTGTHAGGSGRK